LKNQENLKLPSANACKASPATGDNAMLPEATFSLQGTSSLRMRRMTYGDTISE
jgi:hypothetical protein